MKFALLLLFSVCLDCTSQHISRLPLFRIVEGDKYGFIDRSGKVVIPPVFRNAGNFSEGLAPVRLHGLWGYIDVSGKFVIDAQFDYAGNFLESTAIVYKEGHPFYIDKQGKKLFENVYAVTGPFSNGRALVKTHSKKYGIINKNGELLIDTVFMSMAPTGHNTYVVQGLNHKRDSWNDRVPQLELGVIDYHGKFIVPYGKFMEIGHYRNGYAAVTTPPEYGDESQRTSILGYINARGNFVYGRNYDDNAWLNGDVSEELVQIIYTISNKDKSGKQYTSLVGLSGQTILNDPRFEYIYDFVRGRAFAQDHERNYWLINRQGHLVTQQPFEDVVGKRFLENNIALVNVDNKWGAIDSNGKFIFPPKFELIVEGDVIKDHFFFKNYDGELYGLADMTGKVIVPPAFQLVDRQGFINGLLHVQVKDRLAYVDTTGKKVWIQKSVPGKKTDTLNIDFMNRGYFYASSPHKEELAGLGGWGGSKNNSKSDFKKLPVNNNRFEIFIDTMQTVKWSDRFAAFNVYVMNLAGDSLFFEAQDSRLYMNVQARDLHGEWKDIEYLPSSWCGNSYHKMFLAPGRYWQFNTPVYSGEWRTELRIKLQYKHSPDQEGSEVIYSNVIKGGVNPGQFWRKNEYYPNGLMDPYFD
jgi:hypothetical protein